MNWRNRITVKHLFTDQTTPTIIIKLCDTLLSQLGRIKTREESSNLIPDDKYHVDDKLDEAIDGFKFIKSLADGTIKKEDWSKYSFTGEFQDMFNGYFQELYDLGDTKVDTTKGSTEKFIWLA